ncbi:hypothetical protein [Cryobacterium sp. PAMC25264]|uniref:DUF7715 family protein n=1 Tax=Cryobacterium sp. PAMC25264 TaxID=2861288 RepID=UPI001C62EBB5|nr:hypothetical protein [Cryobacterium sp. PAMC25264]QYF72278.1 hypothetical protein KY500_10465 [Cryobacterium sp. PAMC25264]
MSSNRNTTTARVVDIAGLTRSEYESALVASFDLQEWCRCCTARPVADVIDELVALAGVFSAGAVVERRVDELNLRGSLGSET